MSHNDLSRQAYREVADNYTNTAALPTGQLIKLLAYCICQQEAALDNVITREFVENAVAVLNVRIP